MAVSAPLTPSWNPLRCAGQGLPVPLALMAKIVALALLLTGHVRLLPDPFLSFIPVLDLLPGPAFQLTLQAVFVLAALAILFNRSLGAACTVLGLTILLAVVSSKAYYGNNKTMCGIMLLLAGLYHPRTGVWFLRAQFVLVYFGAGLNKLLDPDWQSGLFFDHWASARLKNPFYLWLAPQLPPLVAGKLFCWVTIGTELALAAAFMAPRLYPAAIWVSLLFHASLLEFTGTTFTMFFYVMEASVLVFVTWPHELTILYDGGCGICNRIRRFVERLDFDRGFQWEAFQTGAGDRWNIPRAALNERLHLVVSHPAGDRVYAGFRACKLILLYNPSFLLALAAAIALPPGDAALYRRLFVAVWLAFFFPLFNSIGERVYNWVASNRHRLSRESTCAVEPAGRQ
ncbi:MAG: DUF393 domain-containing protein [Acidobacteria bacterium]|nr:DUF393 domain-containing protein [Acidobacteriota bacterium]